MSRGLVLFAAAALLTVSFAGTGRAQQLDENLNDIRKKQSENTQEITDAEREIANLRGQLNELRIAAQTLSGQLDSANQRLAAAEAETQKYALAAQELAAQIETTQRKLDEAKAASRKSAVLLYQRRSDSSAMLGLIGAAEGSGEIVEGKQYLEHVSDKRHADADRVTVLRAQLAKQQDDLNAASKQADDARDEAAGEQRRIATLVTQEQQALADVTANEATYNAKLNDLKVQKNDLAADFQAESDKIAQILAQSRASAPLGNGTFIRPIPGATIVSGFGYRADPFTGEQAFHSGVDFAAPCGTRILAGGTGLVVSAGENGGYGFAIVLDHGGGLATLYGHQEAFAVTQGQLATQGQVIGYVGSTGTSTGCHLHFEVRVNGTPVDPVPYLT
jgi:murein DD-endopeptidase MepM/ murein hydrolase activator NlpD